MKTLASLTLSLFLCAGTAFADSSNGLTKHAATPAKTAQPAKPAVAKTSAEITAEAEELRQILEAQQKELAAQQEELQLLKEELGKRDRQIEETRETAASANAWPCLGSHGESYRGRPGRREPRDE
jgi:Skp family chaperone for outer membrane proteins